MASRIDLARTRFTCDLLRGRCGLTVKEITGKVQRDFFDKQAFDGTAPETAEKYFWGQCAFKLRPSKKYPVPWLYAMEIVFPGTAKVFFSGLWFLLDLPLPGDGRAALSLEQELEFVRAVMLTLPPQISTELFCVEGEYAVRSLKPSEKEILLFLGPWSEMVILTGLLALELEARLLRQPERRQYFSRLVVSRYKQIRRDHAFRKVAPDVISAIQRLIDSEGPRNVSLRAPLDLFVPPDFPNRENQLLVEIADARVRERLARKAAYFPTQEAEYQAQLVAARAKFPGPMCISFEEAEDDVFFINGPGFRCRFG